MKVIPLVQIPKENLLLLHEVLENLRKYYKLYKPNTTVYYKLSKSNCIKFKISFHVPDKVPNDDTSSIIQLGGMELEYFC